ncbi:MAG: DNA-3-methyladenine glycosylase [Acidobacteriota bacterium]
MKIPIRGPFDAPWLGAFLGTRAIPGLESVAAGEYRRALRGRGAVMGIRFGKRSLDVRWAGALAPSEVSALVGRLFDLDAPLAELHALAAADSILAPLVAARPGMRLPVYDDPFEALIRAILGQQVSVAAARTIGGRMVARFGRPAPALSAGEEPLRFFPEPETLVAAGEEALRELGLTGAKARSILGCSDLVASGAIDLVALRKTPADAATAALRALPGVGPWTAAYLRLRGLGDRDAFPAGDLGVRKALAANGEKLASEAAAERRSEAWRPWRGYATLHLWAGLG